MKEKDKGEGSEKSDGQEMKREGQRDGRGGEGSEIEA